MSAAQGSQTSFALWIINKAGGLIYSRTYAGAPPLPPCAPSSLARLAR